MKPKKLKMYNSKSKSWSKSLYRSSSWSTFMCWYRFKFWFISFWSISSWSWFKSRSWSKSYYIYKL